jgi:hypothetical protein
VNGVEMVADGGLTTTRRGAALGSGRRHRHSQRGSAVPVGKVGFLMASPITPASDQSC